MYGIIFDFLREYVIERHGGKDTWKALLDDNGYGYKVYFPVKEYPDEEIVALATSASNALNLPLPDVLEDFGSFVGPKLTSFYHMYVKDKSWKTLDIIEVAGSSIHDTIHKHNPNRKPPTISSSRESNDHLILTYHSHRKLCPVVRGVVRGLGEKFGEQFRIKETQCMHQGADNCVMHITRI
ncbi:MAG: heme NO-binding domain-containing protein [Sedimenticola sp.]